MMFDTNNGMKLFRYVSPTLHVTGLKTRTVLCQSRDIKDATEDYEDLFGTDDE